MKKYSILLIASAVSVTSYGRENNYCPNDSIQLDSLGNRIAVWSENLVSSYKDGIIDGFAMSFSDIDYNNKTYISSLGFYKNGVPKGSDLYFHPNGVVSILRINIEPNKDFIGAQKSYTKESIFPFQAYRYDFYDNGQLRCEGWEIIGEDTQIDSEKVGVWKYYDQNGNYEIVDFSKDDTEIKYSRY